MTTHETSNAAASTPSFSTRVQSKKRVWTARDEYYLRAAIESAAYHREMLEGSTGRVRVERLDLIERADRNLAALLASKEAAKEDA